MKRILLSLLAVATLVACSKSDDNGDDSASQFVKKITNKDKDGKFEEVIAITYEGGRPISHSYNFVQNFTYENGKLVTKTEKYEGDHRNYTYQYSYIGNQLKSVLRSEPTTIYINGGTQSGTYYEERQFTYRGNTIIEVTTQYEKDLNGAGTVVTDTSYGTNTTTYTISDGNVVKVVDEDSYSISTREYTYDTKRNPFHYMTNFVEPDPTSFLNPNNGKINILTYKNTREHNGTKYETLISFEHTYNADGYPTVVKQYKEKGNGAREFQGTTEYEY